jgi:hypothetical protein
MELTFNQESACLCYCNKLHAARRSQRWRNPPRWAGVGSGLRRISASRFKRKAIGASARRFVGSLPDEELDLERVSDQWENVLARLKSLAEN